jgi:hypothetical protein
MTKYNYQSLIEEIRVMQPWKTIALSAVCVGKIMPIINVLALRKTYAIANECLSLVWSAISAECADTNEANRLIAILRMTPEWEECPGPDSVPWIVGNALSFCEFALEDVLASVRGEKAKDVGFSLMLDITERFDLALAAHDELELGEKGLREAECASQQRLLNILRGQEQYSEQIANRLYQEIKLIANIVESTLPAYCYHFIGLLNIKRGIRA